MSCTDCEYRQWMAKAFDLHWLGEDDCPLRTCEKKKGEPK